MLSLYLLITSYLIGSFLNVVISRLPSMLRQQFRIESVTYFTAADNTHSYPIFNLFYPASHCPICNTTLTWQEKIPLISFIIQRRRCTQCYHPISWRYFLVESITLVLSACLIQKNLSPWILIASLLFTWHLIALAIIDLEQRLLPDYLTVPLFGLGLLCNSQELFVSPSTAMTGGIFGYTSLLLISESYTICTGKIGLGGGDKKLFAAIGVFLGWEALLPILFCAACSALLVCVGHFLMYKKYQRIISFGPYLAISAWIFFYTITL